jgi:Ca2+-binding EF-hand superfamily protein
MDRQKEGAINITNNLSLILSPIRDFDPKDWGCKNCPCNIHSNPNVSCDCCTCNVCPFTTNKNKNPEKQKQRKFPRVSLYSYSYTYEPDTSGPDKNQILNNILNNDPSAKKRLIFNKELNRYEKTMADSTDGGDYENYRIMGNNIKRGGAGDNQRRFSAQDMIYSDQMNRQYGDSRSRNEEDIQDENYIQKQSFIDKRHIEEIHESTSSQKRNNKRRRGGSGGDDEDGNGDEDNNGEGGIRGGPDGSKITQPGQGQIPPNYRISSSLSQIQRNPQQDLDQRGVGGRGSSRNPQQDLVQSGVGGRGSSRNPQQDLVQSGVDGRGGPRNPQQDLDRSGAGGRGGPHGSIMNPGDMARGSQSMSFFPGQTTTTIPPSNPQDDNDPLIRDSGLPSYSISPDHKSQAGIGTSSIIQNPNDIPIRSTTQTIYLSQKDKNGKKLIKSGKDEEESIEDLGSGLQKSHEEIIDENEQIFIKYLKLLIKSEKEIEFARRDLMRQRDYNAEDAFRLFEVEGRNIINKEDLKYGLTILGIKPTAAQIQLLMDRYDLNGNGYIDYDDFFDMVISFKDEDRQDEKRRIPNRSIRNRDINMFSPQTKELYKKLFIVIIEEEERLEKFREKLNVTNEIMSELFQKINGNVDEICDKKEFANYCLRKGVCKEKKDAYLIFIRLNRNRDGGIQDKEFSAEMSSSF